MPKRKSLQRKIERATVKVAQWTARLEALRSIQAGETGQIAAPGGFGIPLDQQRLFRVGGKYFGLVAKVARELGKSQSYVRMVYRGATRSDEVLNAIKAAMANVDAAPPGPVLVSLNSEEISAFQQPGRYYGLQSKLAKRFGVRPKTMSDIASRPGKSPLIFSALRAEMARVDAELATKQAVPNG